MNYNMNIIKVFHVFYHLFQIMHLVNCSHKGGFDCFGGVGCLGELLLCNERTCMGDTATCGMLFIKAPLTIILRTF